MIAISELVSQIKEKSDNHLRRSLFIISNFPAHESVVKVSTSAPPEVVVQCGALQQELMLMQWRFRNTVEPTQHKTQGLMKSVHLIRILMLSGALLGHCRDHFLLSC